MGFAIVNFTCMIEPPTLNISSPTENNRSYNEIYLKDATGKVDSMCAIVPE